ncbi:MAG: ATP-binding cassette domain-containing protein [Pseudonocardiaceae bacterium]
MTDPILALTGIWKKFGSVQALHDVDLEVGAREVVALVGDNGAGKSTLVNVIAGVDPANSGKIYWQGNHVSIGNPHDAAALGIATVYQDLSLCDNLDVVANLFLGNETVRFGVLDEIGMERTAQEQLRSLKVELPNLRVPVSALSGGQRQSVAITRARLRSPKLVILDEPTAALGVPQTSQVLGLIKELRGSGLGVILITHNLTDVMAVADRVVVLRLGHNAGEFVINNDTRQDIEQDIVAAITGASTAAPSRGRSMGSATISITEAER